VSVGKIDQHGEALDAEIGVRLQPEAVGVLSEFQPHITARKIGPGGMLDRGDHLR